MRPIIKPGGTNFDNSHGLDRSRFPAEIWIDALKQVYDDIFKNIKDGKAVISMAWVGVTQRLLRVKILTLNFTTGY